MLSGKMPDKKILLQIYVKGLIIDSMHILLITMLILLQSVEVFCLAEQQHDVPLLHI